MRDVEMLATRQRVMNPTVGGPGERKVGRLQKAVEPLGAAYDWWL
jgi:hypothetical protein